VVVVGPVLVLALSAAVLRLPSATVIVNEPPVYIEQSPPGYWYYCPSAKGYYPSVPSCPESWVRVAPRSQ
jgi:hypothetical protein